MAACGIDLILNAEVSGTTSTHIGSARILTGSNLTASFRAMMGTSYTATASLEVKRFTGSDSILILTGSGIGLNDVSGSGTSASSLGLVNDWYDFYASGSESGVSTLVKGIKITLQ
tara:strand:+ start:1874 stop:2221 length:348 start_codon:yes stop_codon:yes gene_type:complete